MQYPHLKEKKFWVRLAKLRSILNLLKFRSTQQHSISALHKQFICAKFF